MKHLWMIVLLFAMGALAAHVAVLETIGSPKTIEREERLVLTDELRRIAVVSLPSYMGYTIMTRENIQDMLPPGKTVEDCEGSCLVETGRNISADYIAQARVGRFGKLLSVTVELYETATGKLMSSFIGKGKDAEDVLKEIEDKAPALFSIIKGGLNFTGENEGFSGVQQGSEFKMGGNRQFLINVSSKPEGAMVSVDGRPKCKSTPCNIQLVGGSHSFSFAQEMYFDKDTVLDVLNNEQNLMVRMDPNFGILDLVPRFSGYGNTSELSITVDGKKQNLGKIQLSAGKHHVELSHQCYESMSFDVSVKNGSELKFDKVMQPAMGGLSLTAEGEKGPVSLPVFVDGKRVGKTPYQEPVPICAKVGVEDAGNVIPVKLRYHETVEYVFKISVKRPSSDDVVGRNDGGARSTEDRCKDKTNEAKKMLAKCKSIGKGNSGFEQCIDSYKATKNQAENACRSGGLDEEGIKKAVAQWEMLAKGDACKGKLSDRCAGALQQLGHYQFMLEEKQFQDIMNQYEADVAWCADRDNKPAKCANISRRYPKADHRKSLGYFLEFIDKYPKAPKIPAVLYQAAAILEASGEDAKAFKLRRRLVEKFPDNGLVPKAWLRIAEYHFMNRKFKDAIAAYKKVTGFENLTGKEAALAMYHLAESYYNIAEYETAAYKYYEYIIGADKGKYPNDLRTEAMDFMAAAFAKMDDGLARAKALLEGKNVNFKNEVYRRITYKSFK